jgi:hypothetical protein
VSVLVTWNSPNVLFYLSPKFTYYISRKKCLESKKEEGRHVPELEHRNKTECNFHSLLLVRRSTSDLNFNTQTITPTHFS